MISFTVALKLYNEDEPYSDKSIFTWLKEYQAYGEIIFSNVTGDWKLGEFDNQQILLKNVDKCSLEKERTILLKDLQTYAVEVTRVK